MEITESDIRFVDKCKESFSYFLEYIFPFSFKRYVEGKHLLIWAERLQNNKKTATLSARKHGKSTVMYAYIMWKIFRMTESEDWRYMSYNGPLSAYHTKNIKKLINHNIFFEKIKDIKLAESMIGYTWNSKDIFTMEPTSITSFNRGWHGKGLICDDILNDPTNELNMATIETINKAFFEEVLSLPNEGGELHLVGTAQHVEDLFFQIKTKASSFDWASYPAIINEEEKTSLWPEMFPYSRLDQIRRDEIGVKAFAKEYMCSPVWSENAYFKREDIINIIDNGLKNLEWIENKQATVIAGLDIGKVRHPSHFTVFLHAGGLIVQIYQIFMDGWDYVKQVEHINSLIDRLKIKRIYYDDTRSELESFAEQGIIQRGIWMPIKFTHSEKFKLASNFGKIVSKGVLKLQNNQRAIRSILSVNNNLDAIESVDGHGDAFWSIAMALNHRIAGEFAVAGGHKWS